MYLSLPKFVHILFGICFIIHVCDQSRGSADDDDRWLEDILSEPRVQNLHKHKNNHAADQRQNHHSNHDVDKKQNHHNNHVAVQEKGHHQDNHDVDERENILEDFLNQLDEDEINLLLQRYKESEKRSFIIDDGANRATDTTPSTPPSTPSEAPQTTTTTTTTTPSTTTSTTTTSTTTTTPTTTTTTPPPPAPAPPPAPVRPSWIPSRWFRFRFRVRRGGWGKRRRRDVPNYDELIDDIEEE